MSQHEEERKMNLNWSEWQDSNLRERDSPSAHAPKACRKPTTGYTPEIKFKRAVGKIRTCMCLTFPRLWVALTNYPTTALKNYGATGGSRNLIACLEGRSTSRYATVALLKREDQGWTRTNGLPIIAGALSTELPNPLGSGPLNWNRLQPHSFIFVLLY